MEKTVTALRAGDWPEDFSHENGNYQCECLYCKTMFFGHKRRVVCRECAKANEGARISNAN
jgi:hypothetical protein